VGGCCRPEPSTTPTHCPTTSFYASMLHRTGEEACFVCGLLVSTVR
jgi:hypothetical protein